MMNEKKFTETTQNNLETLDNRLTKLKINFIANNRHKVNFENLQFISMNLKIV